MLSGFLRRLAQAQAVLAVLAATILLSAPRVDRIGDNLQIALPMLAWACAANLRNGSEYALRFAGLVVTAHSAKAALGKSGINRRPTGGYKGFPSAHTAAATFGASALAHQCLAANPVARGLVLIAAGFVGAERLETGVHTIWQVIAGALLGWWADRMLRRPSRLRQVATGALSRVGTLAWQSTLAPLRARMTQGRRRAARVVPLLAVLVLPVLAATSGALAQDRPAGRGLEVSGYLGAQGALPGTLAFTGGPTFGVEWQGKPFDMPPYYGLRAVWWRNDRTGFGVEFNHAKVYADAATMAARGFDRLEFTDGLNFVTANVFRRWPGQGRLTPYAGAGLGLAIPHVDVKPSGQAHTFGYQLTGPVVQAVAGASYALRGNWSAFGEAKATWSRHAVDLDSGQSFTTDLVTGAVNLGLSYRF